MPGTAHAPRNCPRAKAKRPDVIMEHIRLMHLPMLQARGLVQALSLVGRGMTELGRDQGDAVMYLADATSERMEAIDEVWLDFIQALRA
jgi:hypothetical protein